MITYAEWWDNAEIEDKEYIVRCYLLKKRTNGHISKSLVDRFESLYLNWDYIDLRIREKFNPYVESFIKEQESKTKKIRTGQAIGDSESLGMDS
jgi:hypothetical protein